MYNIFINGPFFEWDERKNLVNQRKHGVSFSEARTVFLDENGTEFFDPEHSESEERFILWGVSHRLRVLVVTHCYRRDYSLIRIISARKANKKEEETYWRAVS